MRHVWRSGWAACVDDATPRAFSGAKVRRGTRRVRFERGNGLRGVSRLVRGAGTYLVLADVGFIEKRLERARRACASVPVSRRGGARRARRRGKKASEERVFVDRRKHEVTCVRAFRKRGDVRRRERRSPRRSGRSRGGEAGGKTYLAEQRVRRCSTSKSPKFRGEKACGCVGRRAGENEESRSGARPEKAARAVACASKPRIEGAPARVGVRKDPDVPPRRRARSRRLPPRPFARSR